MIFELGTGNSIIETWWDEKLVKHTKKYKHQPYLFVPTAELGSVIIKKGVVSAEPGHKGIFGEDYTKLFVEHPSVVPKIRELFTFTGESDIPYLRRCVIDCIDEVRNNNFVVLHFDLETEIHDSFTDPKNRVLSVACWDSKTKQYKTFVWCDHENDYEGVVYKTEEECLNAFAKWVAEVDPAIITAWNLWNFDLPILEFRMGTSKLSPYRSGDEKHIKGRLCSDLAEIYKRVVGNTTSWSLKDVTTLELDITKIEIEEVPQDLWKAGRLTELVTYNKRDVELMVLLDEKYTMVQYLLDIQSVAKIPFQDVWSNSAIVDALCLRKSKYVLPSMSNVKAKKVQGALVRDPKVGLHKNVAVYDFRAEYPSIIMTWNMSPETIDKNGDIEVGNGTRFSSEEPGLLPQVLEDLQRLRVSYEHTDRLKYKATKIISNSVYGVMAFTAFRLFHPGVANAITFLGRWLNITSQEYFAENVPGSVTIYGDTDSIFETGVDDPESHIVPLNNYIATKIGKLTDRKSNVEIEYEMTFDQLLMSSKKRYYGKVGGKVVAKGIEVVRTNAAKISKLKQAELIELMFNDGDIDEFFANLKKSFKGLSLEQIAIPQGVRTTKANTPHVRAKLLGERKGIVFDPVDPIRILWTKNSTSDVVPFHPKFSLAEYEVDWQLMWNKTIVAKLEKFAEIVNKKVPVLRKTLSDWSA